MRAPVGDVNPKTLENAKRQFVEVYGSALVLNTYLKTALVLVSLVALGLIGLNVYTAGRYADVRPLVVRIDEVGRAEAARTWRCRRRSSLLSAARRGFPSRRRSTVSTIAGRS